MHHKKIVTYIKLTALILVVTFSNMTFPSGSSSLVPATHAYTNIAPQSRFGPLQDAGIADGYELEAFILNQALDISGLLNDDAGTLNDVYAVLHSKAIDVLYSRSLRLRKLPGVPITGSGPLFVVPCFINRVPFYVYIFHDDGRMRVIIHSKKEYRNNYVDLQYEWVLSDKNKDDLCSLLSVRTPPISVVDVSDRSVRLAGRFLEKIGAQQLKTRLTAMVTENTLLISDGIPLTTGFLAIERSQDEPARARAILEQFLSSVDMGRADSWGLVEPSFTEYCRKGDSFEPETFDRTLRLVVLALEATTEAFNEGGIRLHNDAYKQMIDISDVNIRECGQVLEDITKVFAHVRLHDMEHFNKSSLSWNMLDIKEMAPCRILIKHLSDGILPTAISRNDKTIHVNKNFVKVMYKLAELGLRDGSKGLIPGYRSQVAGNSPFPDNLYFSILFSIAIHEIRGHFKRQGETVIFDPDEVQAQAKRGGKYLKPNLIATLFFWFVIAEGGVRCTEPGITKFIEDHPQLFRDLAEEETRTIPEAVIRLRRELELDQVSPGDLPRVPVRKSGKPTLADIFRVFCSEGQAWPPIEIFRRLGGVDRDFFLESLRVLIDSGVITKYGTDLYQVVDRPGETKQKIQQILDEYAARPQTSYQSIQKRLLEVLDPYQKDETHIADVFGIIHNARGYLPVHKIAEITGITAPEKLSRYLDSLTRMETVVRRDHVQGSPAGDTVYRAIPMTAQQALKLKAALYELAFNPKIGISSVRSEIREILAADRPVRIADVFRHISRANKALTLNEILQGLGIEDSGTAAACLSDLIDAGVIIKYPGREGRTPTCGLARLTGDQTSRIAAILDASDSSSGKVDLKELKAKIYTVSETVWANALLDTVAGLRAQPAKQAREKIVIAIETDWLPGLQDLLMQGVIRQLDKLEKKGTVRIVRGSGRDLADKLKQVVETERIPVKNIVVLADRKTVEKQEFALIRAEDDSDPDKAFIVGVDAGELTDNTYVRLLEMLTLALRLASSQKLFSNHSGIKLKKMNSRYYIFTPKAEPFDIEIMKELYSAQKRILSAA